MPLAFWRLLSVFETSRQIEAAVRAAEEFQRAREGLDPSSDDGEHAFTGIPL